MKTWRVVPSVWWPWTCQLIFVEVAARSIHLDLVSLEPCQLAGTVLPVATVFSIRLVPDDRPHCADLRVLAGWAETGASVTILAGRNGRSAWVCLSYGHQRLVLTDATCDLHPLDRPCKRIAEGFE